MSVSENEKAELGAITLQTFVDQFGDDLHAQILLEVLLEGLMNEETVFVFGEPEQEGDQVDHDSSRGEPRDQSADEPCWLELALGLGEKNPADHL
jgi:hypothetical protein